ncbi:MAG: aconitase X catalytic domain-containing protein [Candidatus Bathyarchaeia archaeon]
MYLSKEEEAILDGERGEGPRIAMGILAKVGDMYGAKRLIPVESAHVVESSYQLTGDSGIEVFDKLIEAGARVSVPTTTDPCAIDFERWREFRIDEGYAHKQIELANRIVRIGCAPTWCCTPYAHANVPKFGDHLAWSESNAVAYVNSVVGARTNRYCAYLDSMAAIIGKTPEFGLHLDENRRGTVVVRMKGISELRDEDYPVLGYYLGSELGNEIPVIMDMPKGANPDRLKALGAAGAAVGSLAMYHIVGLTPEARTLEEALGGDKPRDVVEFDRRALESTREKMCSASGGKVDLVATGCPHASLGHIQRLVRLMEGRRVKRGVEFWVSMSKYMERLIREMGYLDALTASGIRVIADTCCNNAPLRQWGFKTMVTDSGKYAYYAPTNLGVDVALTSLEGCVRAAVEGEL